MTGGAAAFISGFVVGSERVRGARGGASEKGHVRGVRWRALGVEGEERVVGSLGPGKDGGPHRTGVGSAQGSRAAPAPPKARSSPRSGCSRMQCAT